MDPRALWCAPGAPLVPLPAGGFREVGMVVGTCRRPFPPNATISIDLELVGWKKVERGHPSGVPLACPLRAPCVPLLRPFGVSVTDGFGEAGKAAADGQPAVPPNATILISLELVGWKKVESVTEDNAVVKKILVDGEGYERPNESSTVNGMHRFLPFRTIALLCLVYAAVSAMDNCSRNLK